MMTAKNLLAVPGWLPRILPMPLTIRRVNQWSSRLWWWITFATSNHCGQILRMGAYTSVGTVIATAKTAITQTVGASIAELLVGTVSKRDSKPRHANHVPTTRRRTIMDACHPRHSQQHHYSVCTVTRRHHMAAAIHHTTARRGTVAQVVAAALLVASLQNDHCRCPWG